MLLNKHPLAHRSARDPPSSWYLFPVGHYKMPTHKIFNREICDKTDLIKISIVSCVVVMRLVKSTGRVLNSAGSLRWRLKSFGRLGDTMVLVGGVSIRGQRGC